MQLEHDFEMESEKLSHKFALNMAAIVCWSVVSMIMIAGVFFGDKTPLTLGIVGGIALVLGIISFTSTRSALL